MRRAGGFVVHEDEVWLMDQMVYFPRRGGRGDVTARCMLEGG